MKNKLKYLSAYTPWLGILCAFDLFLAVLLWLAEVRIFQALLPLFLLATAIAFGAICFVLIGKEREKEDAFNAFLSHPDKSTERELMRLCRFHERERMQSMVAAFDRKQQEVKKANALLSEYEEYVETWAHEIKLPLSLLTIVLDNQRDKLPGDTALKLDHARNQIQGDISQILFYHRVRREQKDFLFEEFALKECIDDVLEDFKPLLEEKAFSVKTDHLYGSVYTDRRSFTFIVAQIIGNAVKYSGEEPELRIAAKKENKRTMLSFKDNGCGVKTCDLPHVFSRGFAGDSGAARKKSTGMGLYLVKQLADDLNIRVEVTSDWRSGFEITLCL